MSHYQLGLIIFAALLTLLFLRVPISVAMLLAGVVGNYLVTDSFAMTLGQMKHQTYSTFSSYSLSIIPLFFLMGQLATHSGMSAGLFKSAAAWLGHKRGGVAMSAIGACAGFGSICGSSLATAATMGQVGLPELRKYGYSGALATGTLAAGGTLGILIPPSVVLVIFAIITEQNIAKLFVAAFIPGFIAALGYMLCIAIVVRLNPQSERLAKRLPYKERFAVLMTIWPVISVFALVIGGIYTGIFTPTEAAAVGVAAVGLYSIFSGQLTRKNLKDSLLSTATSTAMIFMIVLGASIFNGFLSLTQVPQISAQWVLDNDFSPWMVLLSVLAFYLIMGCVMDSMSMVLLTVPIFYPLVSVLDFGLPPDEFGLWFGILLLIVVESGLITPPVGLNLFVINSMAKDVPLTETFKGAIPFVLTDLVRVVLLLLFPVLTLGLVRLLY